MKVLWITNIPFGRLSDLMGVRGENTSGSWLDSSLQAFTGDPGFRLMVVTVGRVPSPRTLTEGNITWCVLPGGHPGEYDHRSAANRKHWEGVKAAFAPDLVQVWGTEFTHGYLALQVLSPTPSVLYIQGLLESVARYYLAGMTREELRRSITLRDLLKGDWIGRTQRRFARRARVEAEMMRLSNHVIVENQWCASHCLAINPRNTIHQCELSIREEFFSRSWSLGAAEPYTIMCPAAGYPIKGLHMLLKALRIVVARHPEAVLRIPGEDLGARGGLLQRLKEKGYARFIKALIRGLGLERNVVFLGPLSSSRMADAMAASHAFVLPSSIENHSSTLIEAMVVGAPCVAAYVGGVPEYVKHGENGLLYRFEEVELLAHHLLTLFGDPEAAARLGAGASATMRASRSPEGLKGKLVAIYGRIIAG